MTRHWHVPALGALSALMIALVVAVHAATEWAGSRMERMFSSGGAITEDANREIALLQNALSVLSGVVGPLVFASAVPLIALLAVLVVRRRQPAAGASATAARDASSA